MAKAQPFLRWVGGKARVVDKLQKFLPAVSESSVYFEPFVGAGSLFFSVGPESAVLGDVNPDLVDCYQRVSDRPDLVWRHLRSLAPLQERDQYLALRDEFNRTDVSTRRAALFIYLNKTCFNGIWRVNKDGKFNVPYGSKQKPGFPTRHSLGEASVALQRARILHRDFEDTLVSAMEGDFAFLDPPYLPLSRTSFFNHYTSDRFGPDQHERVAIAARGLAERGVRVMITEGDSPAVRKWYKDFYVSEIAVRRFVSGGAEKLLAREVVITSYLPTARCSRSQTPQR